MVSPSKHKKPDRKAKPGIAIANDTGVKKPRKLSKLFEGKRFYLDVKNRSVLLKLEKQIKEFGGTVDQFLVKEVNCFVTDRNNISSGGGSAKLLSANNQPSPVGSCSISPLTASPSPSPSQLTTNTNSPSDGVAAGAKRRRSRAEAMLECIREQQQQGRLIYNAADPYENAKAWNIPIYSLRLFQHWLEKKLSSLSVSSGTGSLSRVGGGGGGSSENRGVKLLRGGYIKLEAPGLRPEYKEFKSWPTIRYNSSWCPFDSPKKDQKEIQRWRQGGQTNDAAVRQSSRRDRMTRKHHHNCNNSHTQNKEGEAAVDLGRGAVQRNERNGGYCEMCCEDFSNLSDHIASTAHLKLAANPAQYAALDSLIREHAHPTNTANGDMCPTVAPVAAGSNTTTGCGSSSNSSIGGGSSGRGKRVLRSSSSSYATSDCSGSGHETMGNRQATTTGGKGHQTMMTNGHLTRSATAGHKMMTAAATTTTTTTTEHHHNHDAFGKKPPLLEVQCNGLPASNHCHLTRLSVKTEAAAAVLTTQLSPSAESVSSSSVTSTSTLTSVHRLRSKKQLWLPPSLHGTTAEDEGNPVRVKAEQKSPPRTKGKRRKLRRKRLSVEEKLIEDNKSYYKVEVLNSKLRSTGYYVSQRELELSRLKASENQTAAVSNEEMEQHALTKREEKEPVVVRFKKVRQSELSLLSDEAESFMFGEPRKDNSTTDESSEQLEETITVISDSNSGNDGAKKEIKSEELDESSMGSSSSNSHVRRKRRTHAEVFIHDNLDYYKFDIQGTRLRVHGNDLKPPPPPLPESTDLDSVPLNRRLLKTEEAEERGNKVLFDLKREEHHIKKEEEETEEEEAGDSRVVDADGGITSFKASDLTFSFESVPDQEQWYQTFQRQDEGREMYHPTYTEYPRVRLPYEFPSDEVGKSFGPDNHHLFRFKKKRKRLRKGVDDKPRKSPRCHASTLAILSSLKYRRKRDSPDKFRIENLMLPIQEEDSRSSIVDDIPDFRKLSELKFPELSMSSLADCIDLYFQQVYSENVEDDKYARVLRKLSRTLSGESRDETQQTPSPKGKGKGGKGAVPNKANSSAEFTYDFSDCCLHMDPTVISEVNRIETTLTPGPTMDVAYLIGNYKNCNSMERADYEHLHPRTVDSLRAAAAADGSCNSSDCGGSSTCELLGFTEDGRMLSKRRKRKKRNMTGWPKDKPKKPIKKDDQSEKSENSPAKDSDKSEDMVVESDAVVDRCDSKNGFLKVKVTRSLSRTASLDSATLHAECNMCDTRQPRGSSGHSPATESAKGGLVKRRSSSPGKRPGRGRRKRNCVTATRWAPWTSKRAR